MLCTNRSCEHRQGKRQCNWEFCSTVQSLCLTSQWISTKPSKRQVHFGYRNNEGKSVGQQSSSYCTAWEGHLPGWNLQRTSREPDFIWGNEPISIFEHTTWNRLSIAPKQAPRCCWKFASSRWLIKGYSMTDDASKSENMMGWLEIAHRPTPGLHHPLAAAQLARNSLAGFSEEYDL